jgi:hypothetical protein
VRDWQVIVPDLDTVEGTFQIATRAKPPKPV